MTGTNLQGYVLLLYKNTLTKGWPKQNSVMTVQEPSGIHYVEKGLCEMITEKYTPHNWPELTLRQLQALKQSSQNVDDFLIAFNNLKVKANLSPNFAIHRLLQNALSLLLKKAIFKHEEPTIYDDLIGHL